MASQKDVKSRIASIKNINKITRAMEMVAAAAPAPGGTADRERCVRTRRAMRRLTQRAPPEQAGGLPRVPVLEERAEEKRVGVVLITGDRGLAGAFNANIISRRDAPRQGRDPRAWQLRRAFSAVGRKGVGALTFRKLEPRTSYVGFTDRPGFANAREIGEELTARYVDGELDRVELVYNRFVSPLTQHVWRQTLLPMQQADRDRRGRPRPRKRTREETEIERAHGRAALGVRGPEAEKLLAELIPEYVNISVLPGAAGVRGLGARRPDDGDAQRCGERRRR